MKGDIWYNVIWKSLISSQKRGGQKIVKIIHCADIHLDTVFSELSSSEAKKRREDLRSAFSKTVDLVKKENADMFIISGDLFDFQNVSRNTVEFVKAKLCEISEVPVYICAGNHDPKTSDSYYSLYDFGENVHIFDTNMEWIEKDGYDIYGISFKASVADDSYLAEFKVKNPDKINIMVMHGDFTSKDYNLITKTQMEESGIHYLALGHIHKFEVIKSGKCTAVFPGCPEGRGFDETSDKGVVLTEVTKEETKVSFIPVARRKYHELTVDVTGIVSVYELIDKIKDDICENDLYKIVLTGETNAELDSEVIKDNIDAFFVKVYDKTSPEIDLLKESAEFSLKGLFIKHALSEIEADSENDVLKEALKIGLLSIDGR